MLGHDGFTRDDIAILTKDAIILLSHEKINLAFARLTLESDEVPFVFLEESV